LLARLETGDYPLPEQDISLEETVLSVISALHRQAEEKRVTIHFERMGDMPTLRLNPTAVKVVVSNLLENAIKYSLEGSDVTVRVRPKSGMGATIEVADRGSGIPAGDRDRIFDKFYRGENVKTQTKGTGLGLYISKTLIESMGGAIFLKSNQGSGTCFTVAFPLPSAPSPWKNC
jgi:signal transduction histidine kinase